MGSSSGRWRGRGEQQTLVARPHGQSHRAGERGRRPRADRPRIPPSTRGTTPTRRAMKSPSCFFDRLGIAGFPATGATQSARPDGRIPMRLPERRREYLQSRGPAAPQPRGLFASFTLLARLSHGVGLRDLPRLTACPLRGACRPKRTPAATGAGAATPSGPPRPPSATERPAREPPMPRSGTSSAERPDRAS